MAEKGKKGSSGKQKKDGLSAGVPEAGKRGTKKKDIENRAHSRLYGNGDEPDNPDQEHEELPAGGEAEEQGAENSEEAKKRSLPVRVLLKSLKILLLWLPAGIITLLVLVLLGAKLYLSPERVERLIIENFNNKSNGEISLKVRDFNPYGGFRFDNILIKNGEEFNKTKFVEIEKLVFRYGLFQMLIGNVRFPEIGIYKPRIYLTEKNGVWNAARLMKPGTPTPEEKEEPEEPEEPEGPPSKEISLPISAEFLFKFILDDLRVYAEGTSMRSSLEGLSFDVDIWVPPFKKIPKSIQAVSLLERMKIQLNPKEEMQVVFTSREAEVQPPLILTWKLLYKKKTENEKAQFASSFKFGTYRTPVRFKQRHLGPLNFMVSYDMHYEPLTDYLSISHLGVAFAGRTLLNIAGSVNEVSTAQKFSLRMTESDINLNELYPYYRQVTGDNSMRFGGSVSLYPLTITGDPKDVDVDGEINLRRIYFRQPGVEAQIPALSLGYSVRKRDADMNFAAMMRMPHLFYVLDRSRSGDNGAVFSINASAYNNFERLDIHRMTCNFYNPVSRESVLNMVMDGKLRLSPGQSGTVSIPTFRFFKEPLVAMVPPKLKKQIDGIPLKKPVNLTLHAQFSKGKTILIAALGLLVKVPDFNIRDLAMNLSMEQNNAAKRLYVRRFSLGSRERNLNVSAGGVLDMRNTPGPATDLSLRVSFDQQKMVPLFEGWNLSGKLNLNTFIKGDMKNGKAFGSVEIANLNVNNKTAMTSVTDLDLNFPFEYYLTPKPGESRIAVDKSTIIDNQYFRGEKNFTIKSIKAKHPKRDYAFEYMRDFAATMFFRNNTFEIESLKAYVMNGALYGRNILFNLMDMKPKNMEYRLILDITNVDIGMLDEYDPEKISPAKRTRDAELSLNANFIGKGIIGKGDNFSKELDVSGYINIHKIGEKFANRLLTGLSEEKNTSTLGGIGQWVVDNTMKIKGFKFNLDKGLMYATVAFSRGLFGYGIGIKDEKVQFERIPIQDYLRKIREE